jgi:transcriptional regulator with XRE-family HTH domain
MSRATQKAATGLARQIVRLRQKLGLSQAQLASLLMTEARTVRRWEAQETIPTDRQLWFLQLLGQYAATHGVRAFSSRFTCGPGRYSQPGRPVHRASDGQR